MKATSNLSCTKITIVLRGEEHDDFEAMRQYLSPACPDRFPATEVLAYCLRKTRLAEIGDRKHAADNP